MTTASPHAKLLEAAHRLLVWRTWNRDRRLAAKLQEEAMVRGLDFNGMTKRLHTLLTTAVAEARVDLRSRAPAPKAEGWQQDFRRNETVWIRDHAFHVDEITQPEPLHPQPGDSTGERLCLMDPACHGETSPFLTAGERVPLKGYRFIVDRAYVLGAHLKYEGKLEGHQQ